MPPSWLGPDFGDAFATANVPSPSEVFTLAFEMAPIGMSVTMLDSDPRDTTARRAFVVNQAFARMLGHTVEELVEAPDQSVFTHADDRATDGIRVATLVESTGSYAQWEKRYLHADGHVVWGRVSLSLLRHPDGRPWFAVAHIEDVTIRRQLEERLREQARTDELTGLYNRRAFQQAALEEIARARRDHRQSAVLMIDLDLLKVINDTHGHATGDEALQAVARAIRARLRASDVAGRLGGDEFVVMLTETDFDTACTVAESIRASLDRFVVTSAGKRVAVTASVGVAVLDQNTHDLDQVLAEADIRLLQAKRSRPLVLGPP